MVDASKIYTHYYKIAHISLVTYSVLCAKEQTPDQLLLELELQIRSKYPNILLTYYNKCLYYFFFDHYDETESRKLDLHLLYPQLSLKTENSVKASQLSNPAKPTSKELSELNHETLALVSLSFLKSIKKMMIYNLCASESMMMFGNYLVKKRSLHRYTAIQVDPVLLTNGDLIVSLSEMKQTILFSPAILGPKYPLQDYVLSFVVYVVPSGLRCHFYDTGNVSQNFTMSPPNSSQNLLGLLKLNTGIDLFNKDILWVKLIPNLQHLNNQTSKISRFIHNVENRKFITWPWELCLLQFGCTEASTASPQHPQLSSPLHIFSSLLDYNIMNEDKKKTNNFASNENTNLQASNSQSFSIPSGLSGSVGSAGETKAEDVSQPTDTGPQTSISSEFLLPEHNRAGSFNEFDQHMDVHQFSGLTHNEDQVDAKPIIDNTANEEVIETDDNDLFGDSSDSDHNERADSQSPQETLAAELKPLVENWEQTQETNTDLVEQSEHKNQSPDDEKPITELPDSVAPMKANDKEPVFDIPRDQMISTQIESPSSYMDPGAPFPIMPTPNFPQQSGIFGHSTAGSTQQNILATAKGSPGQGLFKHLAKEQNRPRSASSGPSGYAFSPLLFNPIIKSNIDKKYGKGGKFYVSQEQSGEPDTTKTKRFRETSVSNDTPLLMLSGDDAERFASMENDAQMHAAENIVADPNSAIEDFMDQDNSEQEEEDDEEEESDEDAEDAESEKMDLDSSPLKLNMAEQESLKIMDPSLPAHTESTPAINTVPATSQIPQLSIFSPLSAGGGKQDEKADSPFGIGLMADLQARSISPQNEKNNDRKPGENISQSPKQENKPQKEASNMMGESSNCLPLILRSINVLTIPNKFMLGNVPGTWGDIQMAPGFDIDAEEHDDFDCHRAGELSVERNNLDEFLQWITTNLVFDLGQNTPDKRLELTVPELSKKDDSLTNEDGDTDGEVNEETIEEFQRVFPLSYRIRLHELLIEPSSDTENAQSDDVQLHFLDNIAEEKGSDLQKIYWDSLNPDVMSNKTNFRIYHGLLDEQAPKDVDSLFLLSDVKAKVLKHKSEIINLNFVGLKFWKYLNFAPLNGVKNFQVLLVSETSSQLDDSSIFDSSNLSFLELLKNNYKENHLGSIKKLNLQTSESRPDLFEISDGTLLIERNQNLGSHVEYYKRVNRRLKALAELIKLDIINKTNRYEFDKPLLLLFVNLDDSINSIVQISKICRNFRLYLQYHQLPLVDVFAHVISAQSIIKQTSLTRRLKYLSSSKLSKLSMTLYNKCPTSHTLKVRQTGNKTKCETPKLCTHLVKEPPQSIDFKLLSKINKNGQGSSFDDDLFLHVACERSLDRNWMSAAWSDPHGIVTRAKSWYCSMSARDQQTKDLGLIINEIWDISDQLFKKLSQDTSQRSCGSGSKKFLVLTRISSILPDDELVFWKRLTSRNKEISLIVVLASRRPKLLFRMDERCSKKSPASQEKTQPSGSEIKNVSGVGSSNSSPNGVNMMTSPMNLTVFNFHSPQQFINVPGNFLSPLEGGGPIGGQGSSTGQIGDSDFVLHDRSLEIFGVLPKTPLPFFSSPTRMGMKCGFLMREAPKTSTTADSQFMVLEFSLLSCSAYWNPEALMKILLNQFKKLIVLNRVLGLCDDDDCTSTTLLENILRGVVPWHINAVSKSLDYLVHLFVDEST